MRRCQRVVGAGSAVAAFLGAGLAPAARADIVEDAVYEVLGAISGGAVVRAMVDVDFADPMAAVGAWRLMCTSGSSMSSTARSRG